MIQIILIVLLFVALLLLGKSVREIRTGGNTRRNKVTAILSFGFVLGGTGLLLAPILFPASDSLGASDLNRLHASQAWMVLRELPAELHEKKVAFLVRETELESEQTRAMLSAARKALGDATEVIAVPVSAAAAEKYPEDDRPSFSTLVRAADYDRALSSCDGAGTIIFAAELPRDLGAMRFWKKANLPKIYVLNASVPLDAALKRKLIAGYTILDEKADFSRRSIPAEYEAAFSSRFRLVNASN